MDGPFGKWGNAGPAGARLAPEWWVQPFQLSGFQYGFPCSGRCLMPCAIQLYPCQSYSTSVAAIAWWDLSLLYLGFAHLTLSPTFTEAGYGAVFGV